MPGDSYTTHIENPETLETAPFQFVLGEDDLKILKSDKNLMREFLRNIRIYYFVNSDSYFDNSYFDDYLRIWNYFHEMYDDKRLCDFHPEYDSKQIRNWVSTLPYAEELGLLP